jgi:hypothetical protein
LGWIFSMVSSWFVSKLCSFHFHSHFIQTSHDRIYKCPNYIYSFSIETHWILFTMSMLFNKTTPPAANRHSQSKFWRSLIQFEGENALPDIFPGSSTVCRDALQEKKPKSRSLLPKFEDIEYHGFVGFSKCHKATIIWGWLFSSYLWWLFGDLMDGLFPRQVDCSRGLGLHALWCDVGVVVLDHHVLLGDSVGCDFKHRAEFMKGFFC